MTNSTYKIILGTLGHVASGKSEMVYQLTNTRTQRDSRERVSNITIKAGYANANLWSCNNCNNNYYATSDQINSYECENCNSKCQLQEISFADCPGHQDLIQTMMNSITVMNGAIVIVPVTSSIEQQPQIIQHLLTAKLNNLDKLGLIFCLNKCDLVDKKRVIEIKNELDKLLERLNIVPKAIIPTTFTHRLGIDELLKAIKFYFKPLTNSTTKTIFKITRSFDINKSNINWSDVQGGCVGGSLISGSLCKGDELELRPGILVKEKNGRYSNIPIKTTALSFESNKKEINELSVGCGLVAIGTDIDPYYCKDNMLSGNILGKVGELPPVYHDITLEYTNLNEFTNSNNSVTSSGNNSIISSWTPINGDKIYLQIGTNTSEARITKQKNNKLSIQLLKPLCIEENANILICKKESILKIVGIGKIV